MKTKIFNVMILDKSGSMSSIARQAVTGVNETLASIRSQQLKNPEQDNYVTLVAFCGCELKTIYDQVPIAEAKDLTDRDYRPCCMTPLYDAIGTTITRIHQLASAEDTAVAVTIITDGYENASREYTHQAIQSLIGTMSRQLPTACTSTMPCDSRRPRRAPRICSSEPAARVAVGQNASWHAWKNLAAQLPKSVPDSKVRLQTSFPKKMKTMHSPHNILELRMKNGELNLMPT